MARRPATSRTGRIVSAKARRAKAKTASLKKKKAAKKVAKKARVKKPVALRLVASNGVPVPAVATVAPPYSATVTLQQALDRGYHFSLGSVRRYNLPDFANNVLKHKFKADHPDLYSEFTDEDRIPNLPIKLVMDAPEKSEELYVMVTDPVVIKKYAVKVHNSYEYDSDNVNLWADDRKTTFSDVLLRDVSNVFPVECKMLYHVKHERFVGLDFGYTRVNQDDRIAVSKSKFKIKKTSEVKPFQTLLIDTKQLLVFDKMSKMEIKRFGQTVEHMFGELNLLGVRPTAIFNNVRFIGDTDEDKLTLAFNMGGMKDSDGRITAKLKAGSSHNYYISDGVLGSVSEYVRSRSSLTEDDYATIWLTKHASSQRSKVQVLQTEISRLESKMLENSNKMGNALLILDIIQEQGMAKFKDRIKEMSSLPGIESIKFQSEGIGVTTEKITMTGVRSGQETLPEKFMGKYFILLDLIQGGITIQNLMQHSKSQKLHPQQSGDTSFCLGSYSGILSNALKESEYSILILTMLEYLRDTKLDGTATRNYREYPATEPEKPVAGKVITFFGSMDTDSGYDNDEEEEDEY